MRRLVEPLRRRTAAIGAAGAHGGDRGSAMVLVMVLMLVVAGLALSVTAAVAQRSTPTLSLQKGAQTLAAAESGIDAALTDIRTAAAAPDSAGNVFGDVSALPCSLAGSAGGGPSYVVSVAYFTQDPTGQTSAWRTDHQLAWCGTGAVTRTTVPRYALVTSRGDGAALPGTTDGAIGDRVLEAVYTFQVTTKTVLGGLLLTFGQDFCVQAGSSSSGSKLVYKRRSSCSESNALQLFQWNTDYTIRLSSRSQGTSALCLTGGTSGDRKATLETCDPTRPDQMFGFDDLGSRLRNENAAVTSLTGNCLWAGAARSDLAGLPLRSSADGCGADNASWGSWAPTPRFGAGAASKATGQVVSYEQTGRCFDITGHDLDAAYDIVYPCKSDPSRQGLVPWNHRISYTTPTASSSGATRITVSRDASSTYCFTAPAPDAPAPAFPRMSLCTPDLSGPQWWTRTEQSSASQDGHTFKDAYGRCLDLGPIEGQQSWGYSPWTRMVVATCDGEPSQKWNVPPDTTAPSVTGLRELPRGP